MVNAVTNIGHLYCLQFASNLWYVDVGYMFMSEALLCDEEGRSLHTLPGRA